MVYYATVRGETGHCGIAIDKYRIEAGETTNDGIITYTYDSVRTGSLIYYDLWPGEDYFEKKLIKKDREARYYKLPLASWEREITLHTLALKGVPHKEGYPVDGLLRITTAPWQDRHLKIFLDSLIDTRRPFNAITYNCADFAEQAVEYLLKKDIRAREFVWVGRSTTPNKLFKRMAAMEGISVIKDPGEVVNRNFLIERIVKREILKIYMKNK